MHTPLIIDEGKLLGIPVDFYRAINAQPVSGNSACYDNNERELKSILFGYYHYQYFLFIHSTIHYWATQQDFFYTLIDTYWPFITGEARRNNRPSSDSSPESARVPLDDCIKYKTKNIFNQPIL